MNILLIDDDAGVQVMISRFFERKGYKIKVANNGIEGMRLILSEPFDLVITDILMPEKEGIETIREIKQIHPHIKIIAISGGGKIDPQNYLILAQFSGADRVLEKPFIPDRLLELAKELGLKPNKGV